MDRRGQEERQAYTGASRIESSSGLGLGLDLGAGLAFLSAAGAAGISACIMHSTSTLDEVGLALVRGDTVVAHLWYTCGASSQRGCLRPSRHSMFVWCPPLVLEKKSSSAH